jgi:hypothetical protein
MSDDPPVVNRYNPWGQWRPFMFSALVEYQNAEKEAADAGSDPDLKAAIMYCRGTGYEGIEFVLLSEHWDTRRWRSLNDGVVLTRVWDPPPQSYPQSRPFLCAYDGWLPLESSTVENIRNALRSLQDLGDFFGYQFGVPVRVFVKYRECTEMAKWRDTEDEDVARFRDRMSRLYDLPVAIRTAVLRCTHWHQNGERQHRASDRFVSLWLAFESLALVLYENSGLIHLPLPAENIPQTKRQRRAAQDARVERVLAETQALSPSERVSRAYFEGVIGIRRRVELVLAAMLGEDERIGWLYSKSGPSEIRSKLVHEGWSERDATQAVDLSEFARRLDLLVKELVERVLLRRWLETCELPRKTYVGQIDPVNTIACGTGVTFHGDFSITMSLLAHKRVLRF